MKGSIDKRLQAEKTRILEFKKTIDQHCNFQEAVTLLKYLQQDDLNFIPKYEKVRYKEYIDKFLRSCDEVHPLVFTIQWTWAINQVAWTKLFIY